MGTPIPSYEPVQTMSLNEYQNLRSLPTRPYPSYDKFDSQLRLAPTSNSSEWTTREQFATFDFVERPPARVEPAVTILSSPGSPFRSDGSEFTLPEHWRPSDRCLPFHLQLYPDLPEWLHHQYLDDIARVRSSYPGYLDSPPSKVALDEREAIGRSIFEETLGGNEASHSDVLKAAAKAGSLLSGMADPSLEYGRPLAEDDEPWWTVKREVGGAFNVRMDIAVKKGANLVCCVEVEHLGSGEGIMSSILRLASADGGTYLDKVVDSDKAKLVLQKLCISLSDDRLFPTCTSPPRLAFISDGFFTLTIMLYRPLFKNGPQAESDCRPALLVSRRLPFTSQAPSILTLIASTFHTPTNPPIPLPQIIPASPYQYLGDLSWPSINGASTYIPSETVKAVDLFSQSPNLDLNVTGTNSNCILRRLSPRPTSSAKSPPKTSPVIFAQVALKAKSILFTNGSAISAGITGGVKVVVKEGLGKIGRELTEKEGWWWSVLHGHDVTPRFVGLFAVERSGSSSGRALVTELWGESLDNDFGSVNLATREAIFSCLRKAHEHGVQHNDFAPRNVCVKDGEPRLIDFARSTRHDCQGQDCLELLGARRELRLE
ncbi:hypothetical protein T439DRAFT_381715 [Meredithblackwellia eburnea MCA 4105]